jgi:tetratricopeptide (TPR) repeat protein
MVCIQMGRTERALPLLEETLAHLRPCADKVLETARVLHDIGRAHMHAANHAQALAAFEEALAVKRKELSVDDLELAVMVCNLGSLHYDMGSHERALEYHLEDYRITRNALSAEHPSLAITLSNLGITYRELGQSDKAIECLREAVRLDKLALGPDHDSVGISLYNLGSTLLELGETAAALPLLREAQPVLLKSVGPEHAHTKRSRAWLLRAEGAANLAAGRLSEAAAQLNESLRLFTADPTHGPGHKRTQAVAAELARCACDAGSGTL